MADHASGKSISQLIVKFHWNSSTTLMSNGTTGALLTRSTFTMASTTTDWDDSADQNKTASTKWSLSMVPDVTNPISMENSPSGINSTIRNPTLFWLVLTLTRLTTTSVASPSSGLLKKSQLTTSEMSNTPWTTSEKISSSVSWTKNSSTMVHQSCQEVSIQLSEMQTRQFMMLTDQENAPETNQNKFQVNSMKNSTYKSTIFQKFIAFRKMGQNQHLKRPLLRRPFRLSAGPFHNNLFWMRPLLAANLNKRPFWYTDRPYSATWSLRAISITSASAIFYPIIFQHFKSFFFWWN